jgi:hypothetical protein
MIERSVPGFRSRLEWTGTVRVRAGWPGRTINDDCRRSDPS